MDRAEIARLVDALNHPEAARQRDTMDRLVELGPDIIDTLVSSLGFVEARVRACIIQVLVRLEDRRSLVAMMRYVHDYRSSIPDANGRAIAMRGIVALANPERPRLFDFFVQMKSDEDPFVRGYAVEGLAALRDRRALSIVRDALRDPDSFVVERAQSAARRLETAEDGGVGDDVDDATLLQKIRGSRGGERQFWIDTLKGRENAFQLAATLVSTGGWGAMIGLQTLLGLEDPRARRVARHHYHTVTDVSQQAVCLRIVAQHLAGDASSDEIEMIRAALYSSDQFVRQAALEAAGASGDDDLVSRCLGGLNDREAAVVAGAARALARGITPGQRGLVPRLTAALQRVRDTRRKRHESDWVAAEGFLIRAHRRALEGHRLGRREVALEVFESLRDGAGFRPIAVTALEFLDLFEEGELELDVSQSELLGALISKFDDEIRGRALGLLARLVAPGSDEVVTQLRKVILEPGLDFEGLVIPVLVRVESKAALSLLEELARDGEDLSSIAAQAALKRLRKNEEYIEAEFESDT